MNLYVGLFLREESHIFCLTVFERFSESTSSDVSLLISKISILHNTYKNVQEKKNDTIYFNQTIKNIKELSLSSPNLEILVISTNVWDYEPISSIYKFLKYENINNEINKLHQLCKRVIILIDMLINHTL